MTKDFWLKRVEINREVLRDLIRCYHPRNLTSRSPDETMNTFITAPQAERACEIVREQIRKESLDFPEIQFDIALKKGDWETIASLLGGAWVGVPESTTCWGITGFREAVELLDDPAEEDESC